MTAPDWKEIDNRTRSISRQAVALTELATSTDAQEMIEAGDTDLAFFCGLLQGVLRALDDLLSLSIEKARE